MYNSNVLGEGYYSVSIFQLPVIVSLSEEWFNKFAYSLTIIVNSNIHMSTSCIQEQKESNV